MFRSTETRPMRISRRGFLATSAAAVLAAAAGGEEHPEPKLLQDWHSHTLQAGGKPDATVAAMVAKNEAYGLKLMGISEHIDLPEQREEFIGYIANNRAELAATGTDLKVMIGTEASMLSPTQCCLDEALAQELDYVLVSCNHYHLKAVENPAQSTPEAYANHYLDMLMGAIDLGFVDTIGHPFLHMKLNKKLEMDQIQAVLTAYPEERLTEVLHAAGEIHMAFEINPHHANLALDWFRELIQECRLHGVKFTLGTDAHNIASLGYPARDGRTCEAIVADLGLREEDLKWEAKLGPKARKT